VIRKRSWARFSAVVPKESVWPNASIFGFTMRQPRVVSYIVALPAGNARSGLGTAHGARLMDSTPPPT
jgi:hypothetical protein